MASTDLPLAVDTGVHETPDYWDGVAGKWIGTARDTLWRKHVDLVNERLLRRWLPSSALHTVLKTDLFDEAVASGLYPTLSEYAKTVVGVDISPGVVEAARTRYPELEARPADIRELPFETSSFDGVVSLSTLDHFGSRDAIRDSIDEIRRVMAPGGTLIITLDNVANPVVALRNRLPYATLHRLGVVPYYVGPSYSARGLTRLLRAAHFELLDVSYVLHCPRFLGVIASRAADRRLAEESQRRLQTSLFRFERLERFPTRPVTGYFAAVRAIRR